MVLPDRFRFTGPPLAQFGDDSRLVSERLRRPQPAPQHRLVLAGCPVGLLPAAHERRARFPQGPAGQWRVPLIIVAVNWRNAS